ncbi:MAG TPA: hypothetical protein VGM81_00925 [Burkholderiaceae bacterium]|jgi:hypothetical protein
MADPKYKPVRHDHAEFLEKAKQRPGFKEAYESLESEYARARADLAQDTAMKRTDATKSAT